MKPRYLVGIDPGVKTGLAVWDREKKKLRIVATAGIIEAMAAVLELKDNPSEATIEVRFEDSRQRRWFGSKGREALQGAGSIKRDCSIWQEFCEAHGIKFTAVPPQTGATKWTVDYFQKLTGWKKRTSEHGRDAAALVVGG